jgi:HEAT repeat protein
MPQDAADLRELNSAIAKLWSPDERQRQAAKRDIVQFGSQAIDPLIAALEDLVRNRYPRFATGNEKEGSEALHHLAGLIERIPPLENPFAEGRQYSEQLRNIEIGGRLLWDIIQLLGSLRAEKAIPLLIEIMESDRPMHAWESTYPEMEALCQIGAAAVPSLIEAIESANQRAEDADWYPTGYIIETHSANTEDDLAAECSDPDEPDEAVDAELSEEPTEAGFSWEAKRIIARTAKVLGEIGDPRARPILERVLHSNDIEYVRRYIEGALEKIGQRREPL